MYKLLFTLVLPAMMLTSCFKTDSACDEYDPCGYVVPLSQKQELEAYLSMNAISATAHCSGMYYRIDLPGTGKSPKVCDNINVTYKGYLTDNTVFDEAVSPVNFDLNSLIGGWVNGIPLIKEGGKITLFIPPGLGYGSQQQGPVPPNSILIFEVSLISVQ